MALVSASASQVSANTEPTAYDTRSIALGLTGTSYLERPAAVAINPALLAGIDNKFSFTWLLNPLFVNTSTPVSGPNEEKSTGIALGPMSALFLAGRIAPRAVFGFGAYIEQGYGATFDNVINVDGEAGNTEGEDLTVTFFNGEVALATGIQATDNFQIGLALRLPFARQDADLYQNVGAALNMVNYARVKNQLGGVGFPSPRVGFAYHHPKGNFSIGGMYRAYSKLTIAGKTEVSGATGPLANLINGTNRAQADWIIPHAFQVGVSGRLLDKKLMLLAELRMQFHDAGGGQGNDAQTVVVQNDTLGEIEAIAPFNWRNIWSAKVGAEYQVSDLFSVRAGYNAAVSNIRKAYAQYFTPPPGFSPAYSAGFGFSWEHFDLDFATLISIQKTTIGPEVSAGQTIPVGDRDIPVCSDQQVVRTGCAGTYKTNSYWASISLTYKK